MNASISNVVNLSIAAIAQLAQSDNVNICCLMTGEQGVLNSSERTRSYTSVSAVEADWGSNSKVTAHARKFFSQSPNPVNAGGRFVVGFWRSSAETVPATAAQLVGGVVDSETGVVGALQNISDGEFDVTVDGVVVNVAGLNFQSSTTIDQMASVIDAGLGAGATCVFKNGSFVIESATSGATSTLTLVTDPAGAGTYIGAILKLETGSGAVVTQGAASVILAIELPTDGLNAVKAESNFKGVVFDVPLGSSDKTTVSTWAAANGVLFYTVFSDPTELAVDPAKQPWAIKLKSEKNTRMLFRFDGDQTAATGYMSRMHTVNFGAANSALTMNLKELISVVAEQFTQSQIDAAKAVGLDIYTTIKNTPVLLTSGANGYTDTQYIELAFSDELSTDVFNLLKSTTTKIPQTNDGVNALVDKVEQTSQRFVNAGAFAPGVWSSPDRFGDVETFNRAIEENGFYWLAGDLATQSQAERQVRKSPVLQGALKLSGAFHSVELLVIINE